ncbi:energy-coupling factor ABC transporter ATP-binding protein [Treponema phagedenis]|uniref:ABC transporter ATP-binding protein n=1 Tax=Treponema phagedenis TaxID=162 RepID=UPI000465779B|nr:energy-coupling factor ABC transporter ATP-binding protein [Treponema phagedenis]QEJ96360.1 energy-coupling factor ABC transporter ATP-binding protein [Treponema phagedenis]QEK05090.1 energy-coupling factor ABC transporter ATP-binding protein [Treponema phagedenis]QEK10712.1 energy-coupling factor ABC transporter ATP-binding protein [Treponema phagedenis]QSH94441.1 hypothetical protein C5O78_05190 [Treponema phagedenis]
MMRIQNAFYRYTKNGGYGIRNVNLQIEQGECVLVCGESGCGKTSLMRMANGLIPHFYEGVFEGDVFLSGKNTRDMQMDTIARIAASVFQNPRNQFFNLDTTDEIAFACENIGVPPEEIRERILQTVSALGIAHLLHKNIFGLSGGEKQLIAIASAYALNPEIFVFDEPSANLDATSCKELSRLLQKIKTEGKTILIAEHRIHYLSGIYDRIVYMKDGTIENEWTAESFKNISDEKRIRLGLRSLSYERLSPAAPLCACKEPELHISNLCASYLRGKQVLEGLSFSASAGEVIGIVGKNGQGKTTLACVLCGLHKEDCGSITLYGRKISYPKRAELFYLVMQEPGYQLFTDSVEKELGLSLHKKNAPAESAVHEIMQNLNLVPYKERHPMSLSGGQKQRVAIASALIRNAKILIFDEPTSRLDYTNMQRIAQLITRLREAGKIIFIITHDYEFFLSACTRALIIDGGKIRKDISLTAGSQAEIQNNVF